MLTLGSLFDGSGSFPVAGLLSGINPVWKSEIEPFPIAVTNKRLPQMKHYGDITAMNGAEIEPVDIITFGSPCTDLSVAGKRAGLNAERSGLFFQAVRIIREMRVATNGKYLRFTGKKALRNSQSAFIFNDLKQISVKPVQLLHSGSYCATLRTWQDGGAVQAKS